MPLRLLKSAHWNIVLTAACGLVCSWCLAMSLNTIQSRSHFVEPTVFPTPPSKTLYVDNMGTTRVPFKGGSPLLGCRLYDSHHRPIPAAFSQDKLEIGPLPSGTKIGKYRWTLVVFKGEDSQPFPLNVSVGQVLDFNDETIRKVIQGGFDSSGKPRVTNDYICQGLQPMGAFLGLTSNGVLLIGCAKGKRTPETSLSMPASISFNLAPELLSSYVMEVSGCVINDPGSQKHKQKKETAAIQFVTHNEAGAQICDGIETRETFTQKKESLLDINHVKIQKSIPSPLDGKPFTIRIRRCPEKLVSTFTPGETTYFDPLDPSFKYDAAVSIDDKSTNSKMASVRSYGTVFKLVKIRVFQLD